MAGIALPDTWPEPRIDKHPGRICLARDWRRRVAAALAATPRPEDKAADRLRRLLEVDGNAVDVVHTESGTTFYPSVAATTVPGGATAPGFKHVKSAVRHGLLEEGYIEVDVTWCQQAVHALLHKLAGGGPQLSPEALRTLIGGGSYADGKRITTGQAQCANNLVMPVWNGKAVAAHSNPYLYAMFVKRALAVQEILLQDAGLGAGKGGPYPATAALLVDCPDGLHRHLLGAPVRLAPQPQKSISIPKELADVIEMRDGRVQAIRPYSDILSVALRGIGADPEAGRDAAWQAAVGDTVWASLKPIVDAALRRVRGAAALSDGVHGVAAIFARPGGALKAMDWVIAHVRLRW